VPRLIKEEASDIDLARAFVEGDAPAFDQLFRRYQPRIKAVCMKLMGNSEEADDMVQETFYNVVRSADRIDETFNFSAWSTASQPTLVPMN
jgi:RNA polymerase sigma-70 factor (ECF subfamily)